MQKPAGNGYVQPGVHNKRFLFLVGLIDEHGSNLALLAAALSRRAQIPMMREMLLQSNYD